MGFHWISSDAMGTFVASVFMAVLIGFAAGYHAKGGGRRMFTSWLIALMVGADMLLASPPEAVAAALTHARTLPADANRRPRYLDVTHLPPESRGDALNVLSFHLNALSREPDISVPQLIGGKVIYFDLRDYRIDQFTYGKFGTPEVAEPYFHVILERTDQYGKKDRYSAAAPWLPAAEIAELMQLCNSQVPILRADWFVYQTAVSAERKVGYYEMLGLGKKEADFQKLIGADPKEAKRLKLEAAASVAISTVTLHNRGITRLQALTGGYWLTQDYKTNVDRQNTVRLLDGNTEPPQGDATEQFGHLSNGLFAYGLFNANGDRQDTAPDFIASDGRSTSPDRRVHAMLSCVRCHVEGLRPINDLSRNLFRGQLQLRSIDYDKIKRLRQLYLSDLPGLLGDDNFRYARALKAVNGLSAADNAKLYGTFWEVYSDAAVLPETAARELGCSADDLLRRARAYVIKEPVADPVLASFAQDPPLPIRREHFEESFYLFQKMLGRVP